jgi:hypothetical protein
MNQESLATSWKAMKVSSQDRLAVPIYKTYIQIIHIEIQKERDTNSSRMTDQDQDQLEIAIKAHSL